MNLNLDQVIVTAGSQESLYLILRTLIESGDEVLMPDPGFIPYPILTRMAGGKAVRYRLPAGTDFAFDIEDFQDKLSEKPKASSRSVLRIRRVAPSRKPICAPWLTR